MMIIQYSLPRWISIHQDYPQEVIRMYQGGKGSGTTPVKTAPGSGKGKSKKSGWLEKEQRNRVKLL